MSKSKKPVKTGTIIALVAVIFVGALAASIGIQLFNSPDFEGFGKGASHETAVTNQSGDGVTEGEDGTVSANWASNHIFIIGDSLTQGAQKEIDIAVNNATIDGKVGRNMATGVQILKGWKESGVLTEDAIIVICLANNITGTTIDDAQTIVDMIEPGQSLIMMTGHGLDGMAPANEFIRTLPNKYPFVTVADWDMTIVQSPDLLADDGIHIAKNQGNVLYANLIVSALKATQPKP